jgi:hypothetical protein
MKTSMFITVMLCATIASGTLYSDDRVQFETASVKLSKECAYQSSVSPGGVAFKGIPLIFILREAFKVETDRINGPSWLENTCVDVFARLPQGGHYQSDPIDDASTLGGSLRTRRAYRQAVGNGVCAGDR